MMKNFIDKDCLTHYFLLPKAFNETFFPELKKRLSTFSNAVQLAEQAM